MSRPGAIDLLLGCLAIGALAVAAARTTRAPLITPLVAAEAPAPSEPRATAVQVRAGRRTRSLFRIPMSQVAVNAGEASAPPARSIPLLEVRAIVGGPPWSALVSGWPGTRPMRVVRPGDRFDSLVVAAIEVDRVRFTWADSSWTVLLPQVRR